MPRYSLRRLAATAVLATSSLTAQAAPINLWTRAAGAYADGNMPAPRHQKTLDLDDQTLVTETRFDFQYGQSLSYRGLHLTTVVDTYTWAGESDLVLLHFDNGMTLPIPLEPDHSTLRRLDPFLARQVRAHRTSAWSSAFPQIVHYDDRYRRSRPVAFTGNKVVVAQGELPAAVSTAFSPWRHVTSLTGLEFVTSEAYYRQFQVKGITKDDAGLVTYQGRCQFCHGVRQVGATFGWDFLTPVPIYELKQAAHLYNKVRYPYHDALERGLLMPTQADVQETEITELYRWIKAVGAGHLPPYRP